MISRQACVAWIDRQRLCGMLKRMGSIVELTSDAAVGWRSLGALFLTGGFLAVAAIPLAATGGYRAVAVWALGLTAIITGVTLCWRGADLPVRPMSPMLGFGNLLITLVVIASGQPDGRYSLFYVWVALQAFYFLTPRTAMLHMVSVAAQYALALIVLHGGADQWLLVLGTVVTTGWLIGALRARIERLSTQARTDILTGLANRRGFDEEIESALASARYSHKLLSLVAIDLDGFKAVNDRHGHLAGDAILHRFGQLCAETVDLAVSRLGGDEFAIIASGRDQHAAAELAHSIHQAVRGDPELTQHDVTISIGIATFPAHADSSRSLSRAADRALYHAKELGSDQIVAYGPGVEQSRKEDAPKRPDRSSDVNPLVVLSETLDLRDLSTTTHSQTVARYAEMIADQLGLDAARTKQIRLAGVVHDLGKIGLPDHVLLKPGSLTDVEWQQMERHPEIGAQILESAGFPEPASWVHSHHERPDGTGYPLGLSGSDVSLEARILAVADSYEAMTSDHPYRAALPKQAARNELSRHRGTQFDGSVVDALIRVLDLADDLPHTSRRGAGIGLTDMPVPVPA
jgi:diguanylate cyclase (GGDEF)-like protein/putative nucleotidyltransferase with HDIG domain